MEAVSEDSLSWLFCFLFIRRSNQSVLKEINPDYSLEGLILKLKLQCFGKNMSVVDNTENVKRKMNSIKACLR